MARQDPRELSQLSLSQKSPPLDLHVRDSLDSGVRRNDMIEIRRQVCHSIERRTPEHCESENVSFLRQAQLGGIEPITYLSNRFTYSVASNLYGFVSSMTRSVDHTGHVAFKASWTIAPGVRAALVLTHMVSHTSGSAGGAQNPGLDFRRKLQLRTLQWRWSSASGAQP